MADFENQNANEGLFVTEMNINYMITSTVAQEFEFYIWFWPALFIWLPVSAPKYQFPLKNMSCQLDSLRLCL